MSYDEKCFELAGYFLPETSRVELQEQLAQAIQDAIEDWLESAAVEAKLATDVPKRSLGN